MRPGSKSRLACLLWFGWTVAGATAQPAPRPLALHPENPHYFLFRGKPVILIGSGEHYGAVLNLDFDYVAYLDELQSRRLNHTRLFSGAYREVASSFGITDNTLAPAPNRYVCPWARGEQPGAQDGGNRFDLARWDEHYFRRLRDFMAQAARRGVVVEMNLFCPFYDDKVWTASPMNERNNVNGIGSCPRDEVYTLKYPALTGVHKALVRKIAGELRDFDNLYYEVCNESWFGKVAAPWQDEIVATLVEAESGLPARHLISLNLDKQVVRTPNPAVGIYNFHYASPPDVVAWNYDLGRVIGDNETGFRGRQDAYYRAEAWDFITAGGGLYSNLDYSFTARHPAGTFCDYTSPGGGSPALREQLRTLGDFIHRFDFVRMAPDNRVIRGGIPERAVSARALVQRGRAYAVYMRSLRKVDSSPVRVDLRIELPAGRYAIEWLEPATGRSGPREQIEHAGGERILPSPPFTEDIALAVRALAGD
jgi:hypothetical protein